VIPRSRRHRIIFPYNMHFFLRHPAKYMRSKFVTMYFFFLLGDPCAFHPLFAERNMDITVLENPAYTITNVPPSDLIQHTPTQRRS
jgi:hypothetical protein